MKIVYVGPESVGAAWPMFKAYAEKVIPLTRDRRTANKFLYDLMDNRETLLLVFDGSSPVGFCTTQIVDYDDVRLLQVKMLAGDLFKYWIDDMHETLEAFAKENGCQGMELIGRRGWIKKLERFGWTEAFVTVEKRFDV